MFKSTPLKLFSPVSLLIAFFGFFLPFTDINCNDTTLDTINGIEFVRGYSQDFDITNSNNTENKQIERYDPNIFALNAMLAALMGLVLFIIKKFRTAYVLQAIVSIIGFVFMLGLMIDLKSKLADAQNGGDSKLNFSLRLEFDMRFGYWLVICCFLIAAISNIFLARLKRQNEIPEQTDKKLWEDVADSGT